ncbi:MAG TPA: NAD(P)/FAD-dependent oxidoreductase [Vicinamibacterales bacterium]|nr:NAD(P)/FAD-dependent oxidoreductase [Vicinamibacterales bacterium]
MVAADSAPRLMPRDPATNERPVAVIGAGPAGLTAAYELARHGVPVVVFERDAQVGGLARTVSYKGFRFDIGGHRFFTKVPPVQELWRAMLGPDLLVRPRQSRIFYRGRFFDYPLKPLNVLSNLSPWTIASVLASYLRVKLRPIRTEVSFEDWVSNRFGRTLYQMFFKTYTEKVWGIPCSRISAEWAAQRIHGLSLRSAVLNMFWPGRNRGPGTIKTLIDTFEYPRLGPGMMWERFTERVTALGGRVEMNAEIVGLETDGASVRSIVWRRAGVDHRQPVSHVISTMPIAALVRSLDPPAPPAAAAAASALKYRDFLTVALVIDRADVFTDNWIYVHDESVRVGRIQNYKNWSPDMVPDPRYTCLGLEYFVTEGDDLWTMDDERLRALASREIATIGLAALDDIVDGTVVRMHKAYPVYESGYLDALAAVKSHLAGLSNLQLVGRNGMHRYNNQDHSMLTALLAVRNLFGADYDLWKVNSDDEYHEAAGASAADAELYAQLRDLAATQPLVPSVRS